MVKYFLGELPSEKEQQLEELFFADDKLFDCVQAIKEKLIDDYIHEKLNEQHRALFEQNFLSQPAQREQVEFARALMDKLSQFS